jgi:hypothetical protein
LYATNFSNHFRAKDRAYASEWGSVISLFPEHALDLRSIKAVTRVVEDYYRVPPEV